MSPQPEIIIMKEEPTSKINMLKKDTRAWDCRTELNVSSVMKMNNNKLIMLSKDITNCAPKVKSHNQKLTHGLLKKAKQI